MSRIANRRALLVAVQALTHARQPEPEHYAKVLAALSAVASDDFDAPMLATLDLASTTNPDARQPVQPSPCIPE